MTTQSSLRPGMGVMLPVGAAAGIPGTAGAVSGGPPVTRQALFATVETDATRTGEEVAARAAGDYPRRGWIP